MENNSFYGAPAGWYPDPLGLPQLRWWDSTAWTHQVAEARAPMVMQETTYAWPEDELDGELSDEQELPTRRERREQERRDNIDAPIPTALTLLELEPPSVATLQEPAALLQETAQTAQSALPDLLEPELKDTANERFAPFASTGSTESDFAPSDFAPSDFAPSDLATPDAAAPEGSSPVAETPTVAPRAEPEFPSPMSAARAASLQESLQSAATEEPLNFGEHRMPQRGSAAPFDWNAEAEPARAQASRGHFVQEEAQAPITVAVPHKGTHNFAVWMIALIPLAQLVISLLILTAIGSAVSPTAMAAIWLVPYPLVVGLAAIDRAQLKRTGHERTAHWLWAFLTAPIYLVVRAVATIRESGGGFGPVLVWVVLGLLHIASIVAVPGLLISSLPAVFASQAEQSIVSDAAVIGAELDVTCPTPAVLIDQSFTCTGITSTGKSLDIEVSLQRVNGWIDWRVDDWGVYTLG